MLGKTLQDASTVLLDPGCAEGRKSEILGFIRKSISTEKDPPIQVVIDSGVVPKLVSLLNAQVGSEETINILW